MVKTITRLGISIAWTIFSLLIGWHNWGEKVFTPFYIPFNLLLILLVMFLIELLFFKTNFKKLLNDYLIIALIILGLYVLLSLNYLFTLL